MGRPIHAAGRKEYGGDDPGTPYYEYRKYPEPTVCAKCGLVFRDGRWTWNGELPQGEVNKEFCPACRRIEDKYPGGIVRLEGPYFLERKEEIMNLVRNEEEDTRALRPLQRIMWMEEDEEGVTIYVTYPHLARRIGEKVNSAHKGELDFSYNEGEKFVRVYWRR